MIKIDLQVRLFGQTFAKKDTWGKRTELHNRIESRTMDNFFGIRADAVRVALEPDSSISLIRPRSKMSFVSRDDIENFRWDDILETKSPREYQLVSYIEALLSDVILVLPTGLGKTLISSMLLSRMCRENGNRIGLFVVHRIPLVFQQAEAIRSDTGLRVIGLCSENITKFKVNEVSQILNCSLFHF